MKSKIDRYVGIIVFRIGPAGPEFLVFRCRGIAGTKHRFVLIKFIGGSSHPCEVNAVTTLRRELFEEAWLKLKLKAKPKRLLSKADGTHRKLFYLVNINDCEGILRKSIIFDGDELLYPPSWATVTELEKLIQDSHKFPFSRALEELSVSVS